MNRIRVRAINPDPVLGTCLRDPVTLVVLPVAGDYVPESSFWVRRLIAGEIEIIEDAPAQAGPIPLIPPAPALPDSPTNT